MKTLLGKLPQYALDGMPYDEGRPGVYGKGGGNTTTVQKSDPWEGQQPYLKDVYAQAQNLYNKGPIMASTIDPLAPLSDPTKQGLEALMNPGYATQGVKNTAQFGLGVASNANMADKYAQFAGSGGAGMMGGGAGGGNFVKEGVAHAKDNTKNYSVPTAKVDAATRLQAILNGADDPTFQAYMNSSNQNAADQIMRNQLNPQRMEQLINGGYGGSSSMNIHRAAANDIADTISRNNNALILDHQGKQLDAANIVTGAQRDATAGDIGIYNAGVAGANVQQNAAATAANAGIANRELNLRGMMAGDQLQLDQAKLGGMLAPTYDSLQYGDANRALGVGNVFDTRNQYGVDTAIARDMFNKNAPNVALGNYAGLVTGNNGGGTQTTTAPGGGTSTAAGALGGLTAGIGAMGATGAFGTGGWAMAGASLGAPGWAALGASALLGSGLF